MYIYFPQDPDLLMDLYCQQSQYCMQTGYPLSQLILLMLSTAMVASNLPACGLNKGKIDIMREQTMDCELHQFPMLNNHFILLVSAKNFEYFYQYISIPSFTPLSLIYRRGNFIYRKDHPLSYPFRSLDFQKQSFTEI